MILAMYALFGAKMLFEWIGELDGLGMHCEEGEVGSVGEWWSGGVFESRWSIAEVKCGDGGVLGKRGEFGGEGG